MKTKKYIVLEDCILEHLATVYAFKKGSEIKEDEEYKTIIEILISRGLIKEITEKQKKEE